MYRELLRVWPNHYSWLEALKLLTSSMSVSVLAALNPMMLNMMIHEKIEVKELVKHTTKEFARLLYRGLV